MKSLGLDILYIIDKLLFFLKLTSIFNIFKCNIYCIFKCKRKHGAYIFTCSIFWVEAASVMLDLSVVRVTGIMRRRKQQIHTTIQVLLLPMPACPFVNRHFDGNYLC